MVTVSAGFDLLHSRKTFFFDPILHSLYPEVRTNGFIVVLEKFAWLKIFSFGFHAPMIIDEILPTTLCVPLVGKPGVKWGAVELLFKLLLG